MPASTNIPDKECDLVMKGGVTSGIVYPEAIQVLKDHYVFNSIGGTSAGAVAAAATAAAELGRTSIDADGDGFARLKAALDEFVGEGQLFKRFQASGPTRPVIEMLRAAGALGGSEKTLPFPLKALSVLWSLLRFNTAASGLGLLAGAVIGYGFGLALPGLISGLLGWLPGLPAGLHDVLAALVVAGVVGVITSWITHAVTGKAGTGIVYGVGAALGAFLLIVVVGALAALAFGSNLWQAGIAVFMLVAVGVLSAALGGLLDVLFASFFRGTQANLLGIVNGHERDYRAGSAVLLTDFMYEKLNRIAGLSAATRDPLTFGDLRRRKLLVEGVEVERPIKLEMITTNLSQGVPYRLPFKADQGSRRFIFNAAEMRLLFPDAVVDYMIKNKDAPGGISSGAARPRRPNRAVLPEGYHWLPDEDALLVVVGMRMSLAIPVFFSVVPLYTISYNPATTARIGRGEALAPYSEQGELQDLQRHLFSDGGTTSNFPIQLFDKLIPTRPTFGISLASMPKDAPLVDTEEDEAGFPEWTISSMPEQSYDPTEGTGDAPDNEETDLTQSTAPDEAQGRTSQDHLVVERVELGAPNRFRGLEHRQITTPVSLLSSVVDTARENRETMLTVRPGYRERIVRIRLTQDEGGMNLAMDPATIARMIPLGREAGAKLLSPGQFTIVEGPDGKTKRVEGKFNFDHHRWVRFLIAMSQLETELQKFKCAYKIRAYDELLKSNLRASRAPYYRAHEGIWPNNAAQNVDALFSALDKWKEKGNPNPLMAAGAGIGAGPHSARPPRCDDPAISPEFYFFNNAPQDQDRLPKPKLVLKMSPDF